MKIVLQSAVSTLDISKDIVKLEGEKPQLRIDPYTYRSRIVQRYSRDGGVNVGDKRASSRNIRLLFNLTSQSDADYRDRLNTITSFFKETNALFYLVDQDNQLRSQIEFVSLKDNYNRGNALRIGKDCELRLVMLDAVWEDIQESTTEKTLSDGGTLTINNNSSLVAYPIIRLTAIQQVSLFSLRNLETGAVTSMNTNLFVAGATIVLDSINGKIALSFPNGVEQDLSGALVTGTGLIFLLQGSNQISFSTGFGSAQATLSFRKRYAF